MNTRTSRRRQPHAMNWRRGAYELTDDKRRLDLDAVQALLAETYWAAGRSRASMGRAIRHSLCLGLFHRHKQVGFGRAVTDYCTFAWICDVIVHPAHRKRGLGKWMVERLISHPRLQTRSQVLATRDAHSLYERYGFQRTEYLKRKPAAVQPPAPPSAPSSGAARRPQRRTAAR